MAEVTANEQVAALVANVMGMRSELFKRLLDPRRNIEQECGHPEGAVDGTVYRDLYARDPIAARVIEVFARESFRVSPVVYEVEDEGCETDFERSYDEFPRTLDSGDCKDPLFEEDFYEDDEGSALNELALRADITAGIGSYGVLYFSLADGLDSSLPVNYKCRPKVNFIRPLPEHMAQITQFETDRNNPRYGQPKAYSVNTYDPEDSVAGIGVPLQSFNVHYSRVVHIPSDPLGTNNVFGTPKLMQVLNRVLDLKKLYGGSAEMYWKGAFPGFSIETQPQLGGDVPIDQAGMRDMMEQYFNGLQRYMALAGLTAKTLAPIVSDPTSQIQVHLEAICIRLGIPMRIFLGSERGELSSAQDATEWSNRIRARQRSYVSMRILRPMINKLIALGSLCRPKQYRIHWPDVSSPSDLEKAQYASAVVQALTGLAGGADAYVSPVGFWTELMGKTNEEAEALVCDAQSHAEDKAIKDMEKEAELIETGVKRDPTDPEQNPGNPFLNGGNKNGFGKQPVPTAD